MFLFEKIKKLTPSVFWIILIIFGVIFTICWLAYAGNLPQIYYDIVLENVSNYGTNKSAEMFLIYFLCFFGIFAYAVYYFLVLYNKKSEEKEKKTISLSKFVFYLFSAAVLIYLILNGKGDITFLTIFFWTLLVYIKRPEKIIEGLAFFLLNLFSVFALYRFYVWAGGGLALKLWLANLIAFGFSAIVFLNNKLYEKNFTKVVLIEQFILPFLLLVFVANRYLFNGEIIYLNPLPQILIFIYGLIVVFLFRAYKMIKENWNRKPALAGIISLGSCLSIIGFTIYNNIGLVVPTDFHHPFENIIGFHQIFIMGQIPFKEYIPVSGMYSVLHGAIFQIFGNGLISHYYITFGILLLFSAFLAFWLFKKHINNIGLLFFAAFVYCHIWEMFANRYIFILPIMLLLSMPKLIKNKGLWLQLWFLTSLFHGLYYPLYGAAVCLAFAPLGIYQFITYIKDSEFKQDFKKPLFWGVSLTCIISFILTIPLLIGTYKHIKVMGGQTILADGLSRFGQQVINLFPYLSDSYAIKYILVYLLTFLVPALIVWVCFALSLKLFDLKKNKKITSQDIINGCLGLSLVIAPLVAFSFTAVRLNFINNCSVFARGVGILTAISVMIFLYTKEYIKKNSLKYVLFAFAFLIPILSGYWEERNYSNKLLPFYSVKSGYVLVKNDTKYKIGNGFVNQENLEQIQNLDFLYNQKGDYFAGRFGIYYLKNLAGISVLERYTTRGFNAAQETISLLKQEKPYIFLENYIVEHYYLYKYILTSGDYVLERKKAHFAPNTFGYSKEQIKQINSSFLFKRENVHLTASSLGKSFEPLKKIFTPVNIGYSVKNEDKHLNINFDRNFPGDEADFIYLEFDLKNSYYGFFMFDVQGGFTFLENPSWLTSKLVKKFYNPEHFIEIHFKSEDGTENVLGAIMEQGKLLVPMGAVGTWLFENHQDIQIFLLNNGKENSVPAIKTLKLLKLREVK